MMAFQLIVTLLGLAASTVSSTEQLRGLAGATFSCGSNTCTVGGGKVCCANNNDPRAVFHWCTARDNCADEGKNILKNENGERVGGEPAAVFAAAPPAAFSQTVMARANHPSPTKIKALQDALTASPLGPDEECGAQHLQWDKGALSYAACWNWATTGLTKQQTPDQAHDDIKPQAVKEAMVGMPMAQRTEMSAKELSFVTGKAAEFQRIITDNNLPTNHAIVAGTARAVGEVEYKKLVKKLLKLSAEANGMTSTDDKTDYQMCGHHVPGQATNFITSWLGLEHWWIQVGATGGKAKTVVIESMPAWQWIYATIKPDHPWWTNAEGTDKQTCIYLTGLLAGHEKVIDALIARGGVAAPQQAEGGAGGNRFRSSRSALRALPPLKRMGDQAGK